MSTSEDEEEEDPDYVEREAEDYDEEDEDTDDDDDDDNDDEEYREDNFLMNTRRNRILDDDEDEDTNLETRNEDSNNLFSPTLVFYNETNPNNDSYVELSSQLDEQLDQPGTEIASSVTIPSGTQNTDVNRDESPNETDSNTNLSSLE